MGWRKPIGVIRGPRGDERTMRTWRHSEQSRLRRDAVAARFELSLVERVAERHKQDANDAKAKLLELTPLLVRVRELSERMRNEVYGCQISFDPRAFSTAYFEKPGFRACEHLTQTVADLCAHKVRECMRQWQVEHGMGRSY